MPPLFAAIVLVGGLCVTAEQQPAEVDIVMLGTYDLGAIASLSYIRPPTDLAISDANTNLANKVVFNMIYLNVTPTTINCERLVEESEYLQSRWFYQDRRPPNQAATIIMPTGKILKRAIK